jgi:hypothetical protein
MQSLFYWQFLCVILREDPLRWFNSCLWLDAGGFIIPSSMFTCHCLQKRVVLDTEIQKVLVSWKVTFKCYRNCYIMKCT